MTDRAAIVAEAEARERAAVVAKAKMLLRVELSSHRDPSVRLLAGIGDIPDDHPDVVRIAAALELGRMLAERGDHHQRKDGR